MTRFATHLAGDLVAIATATATTSPATMKSSIVVASHGTTTASTSAATLCGICTDMLVFLLRLYPCLCGKKLRIHVIKCLRFSLSGKRFDERIVVEVEPSEDVAA
jgi:hypothetical protein